MQRSLQLIVVRCREPVRGFFYWGIGVGEGTRLAVLSAITVSDCRGSSGANNQQEEEEQ